MGTTTTPPASTAGRVRTISRSQSSRMSISLSRELQEGGVVATAPSVLPLPVLSGDDDSAADALLSPLPVEAEEEEEEEEAWRSLVCLSTHSSWLPTV
jgi:hypothetical protein